MIDWMRRYVPEAGHKDDPENAADVGIGHHASRGKAHSERLEQPPFHFGLICQRLDNRNRR